MIHKLYIKKDNTTFSDIKKVIEFENNTELMKYVKRYRIKYYRVSICGR